MDFGRLLADPIMEDTVVKQLFISSQSYVFPCIACGAMHAPSSKHRFFSRFLVPDRRYSDSAAGTFWTANRFTKTRTFQNGSKRAT